MKKPRKTTDEIFIVQKKSSVNRYGNLRIEIKKNVLFISNIEKKGGKRTLSKENTFSFYKNRIELKTTNECYKNGFMSCYCDKPFFSVYNVPNVRFGAYFSMKFLFLVHIGLKGCDPFHMKSQSNITRMLALGLKSIIYNAFNFFFE